MCTHRKNESVCKNMKAGLEPGSREYFEFESAITVCRSLRAITRLLFCRLPMERRKLEEALTRQFE